MSARKLPIPLRMQEMKQRRMRRLRHKQVDRPTGASTGFSESSRPEKLPDVIRRFIEPWVDVAKTTEDLDKLLSLAVIAWNAAILPFEARQAYIDDIACDLVYNDGRALLNESIEMMIERKLTHFPRDVRVIMKYDVEKLGNGDYILGVSSINMMLPPP